MYMVFISRRFVCIIFLIIESLILIIVLIRSSQGYIEVLNSRKKNDALHKELKLSIQETQKIELQVHEWKGGCFLQEKHVREKLHMGKRDEKVFFYEEQ
jgi:cell division protein FtsB